MKKILIGLAILHILPSFIAIWLCVFDLMSAPSNMQFFGLTATAAIGFLLLTWEFLGLVYE